MDLPDLDPQNWPRTCRLGHSILLLSQCWLGTVVPSNLGTYSTIKVLIIENQNSTVVVGPMLFYWTQKSFGPSISNPLRRTSHN
jgi:hypothetical protein